MLDTQTPGTEPAVISTNNKPTGDAKRRGCELRILVLDDDLVMQEIVTWTLRNLGYKHIDTATDGNIALGKLITAALPYDVVICDLNMPSINGVEFSRQAIEGDFTGGIVLLSGEEERLLDIAGNLIRDSQATLLGALAKPLDSVTLGDLLEGYCNLPVEMEHAAPGALIKKWELEQGITSEDAILLAYQPVIDIATGRVTAVEALVRWQQAERGLLMPNAFIGQAIKNDLIEELSERIYQLALDQITSWEKAGLSIEVSLNLAIEAFVNPGFRKQLIAMAKAKGVDPHKLSFEFKQTDIDTSDHEIMEALMDLRLEGFKLIIDNFGESGIGVKLLRNTPFTGIKIDMSVINELQGTECNQAMLGDCLELARKMSIGIGAKRVSEASDADSVITAGCDFSQGNYYSMPVIGKRILPLIKGWQQ